MSIKKLLVHRHEYGISTAFCNCEGFKDEDFFMTEEQAIKLACLCGLSFDPSKGEELEMLDIEESTTDITRDQIF